MTKRAYNIGIATILVCILGFTFFMYQLRFDSNSHSTVVKIEQIDTVETYQGECNDTRLITNMEVLGSIILNPRDIRLQILEQLKETNNQNEKYWSNLKNGLANDTSDTTLSKVIIELLNLADTTFVDVIINPNETNMFFFPRGEVQSKNSIHTNSNYLLFRMSGKYHPGSQKLISIENIPQFLHQIKTQPDS